MQKKPNFTVLRKQIEDVAKVLSQQGLIDPKKPSMGKNLVDEIVWCSMSNRDGNFVKFLPYKNVELWIKTQMSDVSTDGETIHVTPVITNVNATNYPFRIEGIDCPEIERLCNEAAQEALATSNV